MNIFRKVFNFYYYSFKNLNKLGLRLVLVILVKLFIMFAILKVFFFPNFLDSKFDTDKQKSEYIIDQLTK